MQGAGQQPGVGRVPVGVPLVAAEDLHLGVLVEQHLAEVDGLDAVDERLVGLVEQRDPAVGQPLDEVDLPQRPGPVERPRDDPRDQLAQLLGVARAGQRGAAYVVADVEVLVVDPDRVGQVPGDRLHPLAVARHERDPVEDQRHEPVVVEGSAPRSPGSKTSTVALWRGVVGVSSSRNARSRGRSRSLIYALTPDPSAFGRRGILTEVSGRPRMPSVTIVGATSLHPANHPGNQEVDLMRRALAVLALVVCTVGLAGCGDDDSQRPSDGEGPGHQDHRRHHHGRRRHARTATGSR